ncbi:hypothetical protein D3C73_1092210 [compost metagenome]
MRLEEEIDEGELFHFHTVLNTDRDGIDRLCQVHFGHDLCTENSSRSFFVNNLQHNFLMCRHKLRAIVISDHNRFRLDSCLFSSYLRQASTRDIIFIDFDARSTLCPHIFHGRSNQIASYESSHTNRICC